MGKRSAIAMFLWGAAPVILACAAIAGHAMVSLAPSVAPVMVLAALFGSVGCFVGAKWPLPRKGRLTSFGPGALPVATRPYYWCGWAFLALGFCLMLGFLPYLRQGPFAQP
jgi:hypothetical protein